MPQDHVRGFNAMFYCNEILSNRVLYRRMIGFGAQCAVSLLHVMEFGTVFGSVAKEGQVICRSAPFQAFDAV